MKSPDQLGKKACGLLYSLWLVHMVHLCEG
jgi:hypothetical protein